MVNVVIVTFWKWAPVSTFCLPSTPITAHVYFIVPPLLTDLGLVSRKQAF
jgi:hypothetical protein